MDEKLLSEIMSRYKFVGNGKWVVARGRTSDSNKLFQMVEQYHAVYPTASVDAILADISRLQIRDQQEKDREQQEKAEAKAALLGNFNKHDEVTLAESLRESLNMQGSTWNCYKMDGRPITKGRAKTACEARTVQYNCSIPICPWTGKKLSPPLSKADVWTIFTQIGNDEEFLAFEDLRKRLKFQPDLSYDDLASDLFDIASIENSHINRIMLKHWMANVKRCVYGQPPLFSICLNLYGSQGTGKTTLSKFLTRGGVVPAGITLPNGEILKKPRTIDGPLGSDYAAEADFGKFQDDNFFAWASSYYALIVSEPGGENNIHLSAKEVNTFKRVLDCEEFTSRVYYTQETQKTPNTFAMIASTNKHLYKIITDSTGQRRLFEFEMNNQKLNSGIYVFPYLALWQSVDENSSCIGPHHPLWEEINGIWDTYTTNSTIDCFLNYSKTYGVPDGEEGVLVDIDKLYVAYDSWVKENHYMAKNRGNFEEDLPSSGILVDGTKARVKIKKAAGRGFTG